MANWQNYMDDGEDRTFKTYDGKKPKYRGLLSREEAEKKLDEEDRTEFGSPDFDIIKRSPIYRELKESVAPRRELYKQRIELRKKNNPNYKEPDPEPLHFENNNSTTDIAEDDEDDDDDDRDDDTVADNSGNDENNEKDNSDGNKEKGMGNEKDDKDEKNEKRENRNDNSNNKKHSRNNTVERKGTSLSPPQSPSGEDGSSDHIEIEEETPETQTASPQSPNKDNKDNKNKNENDNAKTMENILNLYTKTPNEATPNETSQNTTFKDKISQLQEIENKENKENKENNEKNEMNVKKLEDNQEIISTKSMDILIDMSPADKETKTNGNDGTTTVTTKNLLDDDTTLDGNDDEKKAPPPPKHPTPPAPVAAKPKPAAKKGGDSDLDWSDSESEDNFFTGGVVKAPTPPPARMMTPELRTYCGNLLNELIRSERGFYFREPIDWERWGLDDYPEFCKGFEGASDLYTVRERFEKGEYDTPGKFADDVRNVFRIAMRYHWRGAEQYKVHIKATVLMDEFEAQYQLLLRMEEEERDQRLAFVRAGEEAKQRQEERVQQRELRRKDIAEKKRIHAERKQLKLERRAIKKKERRRARRRERYHPTGYVNPNDSDSEDDEDDEESSTETNTSDKTHESVKSSILSATPASSLGSLASEYDDISGGSVNENDGVVSDTEEVMSEDEDDEDDKIGGINNDDNDDNDDGHDSDALGTNAEEIQAMAQHFQRLTAQNLGEMVQNHPELAETPSQSPLPATHNSALLTPPGGIGLSGPKKLPIINADSAASAGQDSVISYSTNPKHGTSHSNTGNTININIHNHNSNTSNNNNEMMDNPIRHHQSNSEVHYRNVSIDSIGSNVTSTSVVSGSLRVGTPSVNSRNVRYRAPDIALRVLKVSTALKRQQIAFDEAATKRHKARQERNELKQHKMKIANEKKNNERHESIDSGDLDDMNNKKRSASEAGLLMNDSMQHKSKSVNLITRISASWTNRKSSNMTPTATGNKSNSSVEEKTQYGINLNVINENNNNNNNNNNSNTTDSAARHHEHEYNDSVTATATATATATGTQTNTVQQHGIDDRLMDGGNYQKQGTENGDKLGSLPDLGSPRSPPSQRSSQPTVGKHGNLNKLIDDDKETTIKTPHGFVASDRRNSVSIMRRGQGQPKLLHAASEPQIDVGDALPKLKDRSSSTQNVNDKKNKRKKHEIDESSPPSKNERRRTNSSSGDNLTPAKIFSPQNNFRRKGSKERIADFSPNTGATGLFQYPNDDNNNNNKNGNNNNNKQSNNRPFTPLSLASNTATDIEDLQHNWSDAHGNKNNNNGNNNNNNNNNKGNAIHSTNITIPHTQPQTVPENEPLATPDFAKSQSPKKTKTKFHGGSEDLKEVPYLEDDGFPLFHAPGSYKFCTAFFIFLTLILWVFAYRLFNHNVTDGSIRVFPVTNGIAKILFGIWEIIHFVATFGSIMAVHRGCLPGAFHTVYPHSWMKACGAVGLLVFIVNIIRLASNSCLFEETYQIIKKVSILGGMIIPYYLHMRWRMSSLQWLIVLFWISKLLMDYTSVIEEGLVPELIYFLFYGVCMVCWMIRTYMDRKYLIDGLGHILNINDPGFTALLVACALIIPQLGGAFLVSISAMDNSNSNETIDNTFIVFFVSKCTFWIVRSLWEYAAFQATDHRRYAYLMFPILFCEEMLDALLLLCIKFEWYWFVLLLLISINNLMRNSDLLHRYVYVTQLMNFFSERINIHQRESNEERLARVMLHNDMWSFCEWLARGSVFTILITDTICDSLNIGSDLILHRVPETRTWALIAAASIACGVTLLLQITNYALLARQALDSLINLSKGVSNIVTSRQKVLIHIWIFFGQEGRIWARFWVYFMFCSIFQLEFLLSMFVTNGNITSCSLYG